MWILADAERAARLEDWSDVQASLAALDPDADRALSQEPIFDDRRHRLLALALAWTGHRDAGPIAARDRANALVRESAPPARIAVARVAWAEVASVVGDFETARTQLEAAHNDYVVAAIGVFLVGWFDSPLVVDWLQLVGRGNVR